MAEENQFFRPVRDFCQRKVMTCGADDALVEAVMTMRERNISSMVVLKDGMPDGIFTDRDLRNKVVAPGRSPSELKVGDVMHSPLITIGDDDLLYEALHRMSRTKIHRLVVVDDKGALTGIITDTDILRLQAHSPHQLVLDIEQAASIDDLRQLHTRIQNLVLHLSGTGIAIRDMVKLIANLNKIFSLSIRVVRKLCKRNKACLLSADINLNLVRRNAEHCTHYPLICI